MQILCCADPFTGATPVVLTPLSKVLLTLNGKFLISRAGVVYHYHSYSWNGRLRKLESNKKHGSAFLRIQMFDKSPHYTDV